MKEKEMFEKDEYWESVSELEVAREYDFNSNEFAFTGNEYSNRGNEYAQPLDEYTYVNEQSVLTEQKVEKVKKAKKIRKMSYLVASTVAVVTIGQAAGGVGRSDWNQQTEKPIQNAGGFFVEGYEEASGHNQSGVSPQKEVSIPKQEPLQGTMFKMINGYEAYSSNGIICDMYGGLGLYDYNGREIVLNPEKEDGFWNLRVSDHYIMTDNVVYDRDGKLVWTVEMDTVQDMAECRERYIEGVGDEVANEEISVYASGEVKGIYNHILCYTYHISGSISSHGWVDFLSNEILVCKDLETNEIIYKKELEDSSYGGGGNISGFSKGKMLFSYNEAERMRGYGDEIEEPKWRMILLDVTSGTLRETILMEEDGEAVEYTGGPISPSLYGGKDNSFLVSTEGGYGWYDLNDRTVKKKFSLNETKGLYDEVESMYFKEYVREGVREICYQDYLCLKTQAKDSYVSKDYLFSMKDIDGSGRLTNPIAIYDEIIFDAGPYLVVKESAYADVPEKYYYIDWDGNVVGGPYDFATRFNSAGYAAIDITDEQEVCIINSDMEIVETIYGASIGYMHENSSSEEVFFISLVDEYHYYYTTESGGTSFVTVRTPFEEGCYAYYYDGKS